MHHALLYIGSSDTCDSCIESLQKELNVSPIDTRVYKKGEFFIEDARDLKGAIYTTPLSGEKTLAVVAVEKMGIHPQNALLKITEEPPAHAHIVLILPNEDMLLPTLRSRLMLVDTDTDQRDMSQAKEFLNSDTAQRQKITGKILKNKDTVAGKNLIRDLEYVLGSVTDKEKYKDELGDLIAFRQYVEQRGAGMKYMLEHLALTLPHHK